jgi:hypothetical protein
MLPKIIMRQIGFIENIADDFLEKSPYSSTTNAMCRRLCRNVLNSESSATVSGTTIDSCTSDCHLIVSACVSTSCDRISLAKTTPTT